VPSRSPQRTAATEGLLSIGALSAATGIPVETIRSWERRYGFPEAERKPSGHRVYSLATVPRLRRIAQALALGHRAAEVLPASESALEALMAAGNDLVPIPSPSLHPAPEWDAAEGSDLLPAVRRFDGGSLKAALHQDWARLGPLEFLERRAAPFLLALGDGWADGSLDVRHEHFGSAILGDLLGELRRPIEDRATGPYVALATLPGELHGLGLQMSALVFALAGWRPVILGVDTPVPQITSLWREVPLGAVALSCVLPRGRSTAGSLQALRRRLPPQIALLVGGSGAPSTPRSGGITLIPDLYQLDVWLKTRRAA
jgi:hypothetical protein